MLSATLTHPTGGFLDVPSCPHRPLMGAGIIAPEQAGTLRTPGTPGLAQEHPAVE